MWHYPYIILSIIAIFFAAYIFLRFKYGFWFYQPVFHYYDLKYYFFPPGIIDHNLPETNKFTNFKSIETFPYEKVSDFLIEKFANFIQIHYLQNNYNKFLPQKNNIVPYFSNLSGVSFFSFYYETILLQDSKTNEMISDKKIIGVTTSRPIHITINNGSNDAHFNAYYVDYLCVDKEYRKKEIAHEVIQTHHYNQRHLNKEISVTIFKREGKLFGIVPLCSFSTYGFSMKTWNLPDSLPPQYSLIECNAKNFYLLVQFLKEKEHLFDICIITRYANILDLIKTENIYAYFTLKENEINSVYFFRKTCIYVDKENEALLCFASINAATSLEIFIQGYKNALYKIIDKNKGFKSCVIENTSHNHLILQNILQNTTPFAVLPTAYYFYNFAYPTFSANKVISIC